MESTAPEDTQRGSAGSSRSSGGSRRPQNVSYYTHLLASACSTLLTSYQPQQQLSQIEKSVTHLLVATKQLLETLTLWSRGAASETEVSDVYVRLGYEFNIACRAFNAIGVETNDLGPVPDMLRTILEDTLSQEASQASLDRYLPKIRDIIINLLHGLKKKQQRLRQRNGSMREGDSSRPPRQISTTSNASVESTLTQQLEDVPSRQSSSRSFAQRVGSADAGGPELPPRTTSAASGKSSPRRQNLSPQNSLHQVQSRDTISSDSGSSMSSNALQNIPVIAPYPETDSMPGVQAYELEQPPPEVGRPPSKQNDALTALQRGGELERRASRRFSQYQIQKQLGPSVSGIPTIPPAQHSPIPNRGRDVKEGMTAVRSRGSVLLHSRGKSRQDRAGFEPSPSRVHERRISERSEEGLPMPDGAPIPAAPTAKEPLGSPMVKTPEDKLGTGVAYPFPNELEQEKIGATINGPMEEPFAHASFSAPTEKPKDAIPKRSGSRTTKYAGGTPPQFQQFIPETSPQPGKELTLFLQYKTKIKKFVLPDGGDLSIGKLQLAFIEKFAWNTHNNGVDLPDIYIQDSVSGVRYELEDLSDIKEGSVLVLNIEALDEVKRHIDDQFGGIRRIVEGIKTGLEDQQSALRLVSSQQQETAKEIATLAASPTTAAVPARPMISHTRSVSVKDAVGQLEEVQKMRRDLAVMRQTYSSFISDMNASMAAIRTKASHVKKAAIDATIPDMESGSGRAYVTKRTAEVSIAGEKILDRVDELQDRVEDLRKDVVSRGVRPHPRQLESVSKDIAQTTTELKKHIELLKKEKPIWTKQWERDLQLVCEEKELLTVQEELGADLEHDLENAVATFTLVEQACKQQNLQSGGGGGAPVSRSSSRNINTMVIDRGANPHEAKEGVLGEVRALHPNHEGRLEAIERLEKMRLKDLETRKKDDEFQRELGTFVEEGKLKRSGGVEEVERLRKFREEKAIRENWERQQARDRARAEKQAAEKAAQAAGANGESAATPFTDGDAAAEESSGTTDNGRPHGPSWESSQGNLEVPAKYEGERESSPEPVFVEAKEDVGTPTTESGS